MRTRKRDLKKGETYKVYGAVVNKKGEMRTEKRYQGHPDGSILILFPFSFLHLCLVSSSEEYHYIVNQRSQ